MAIDPVTASLAGVGSLISMGGALANLIRKQPKIHGASGGTRVAQAQTQAAADKLASGGGLNETQYNRMLEGGQEAAKQGIRQAGQYTRENPFMSSAAAERIATEMFDKSSSIMQKTSTDALLMDINKAEENLGKSGELYARSAAMAEDIRKADQEAADARAAQKLGIASNFVQMASGAAKFAGNLYSATGGMKTGGGDEFADHWANQKDIGTPTIDAATSIGTGVADIATQQTQPTGGQGNNFDNFQNNLYGDQTDAPLDMNRRYKSFGTLESEVDQNMKNAKSFSDKTLGPNKTYKSFDQIESEAQRSVDRGEVGGEYESKQINRLRDGMIPGSFEDKQLESNYNFLKELGYEGEELESFLNTVVK